MVDTSDEWITTRTGIKERRIAAEGEATSDWAVKAAEKALSDAGVGPEDIDLLIVATATGDYTVPSTASIVQHRLGIPDAAAYDLGAGCSGFVYALDQAWHAVRSGGYNKALVIGADLLSRIVNWEDRSTCVLFGDGAGAVGRRRNGAGATACWPPIWAATVRARSRSSFPRAARDKPATVEAVAAGEHFLRMAGNEVFKFAVRIMEDATREVLRRAGLTTGRH